jgi:hypothetical protein
MIGWLINLNDASRLTSINEASRISGISAKAIEKDWWVTLLEKTRKLSPVRRSKLTPSKQSIWSMFNSEVYIFNRGISRGRF